MALITKDTSRAFHRRLFAPMIAATGPVTLLKRDDNQRQGTVRSVVLYEAWRGSISKDGQTIQGDMSSNHRTTWHLAVIELERVGVAHLNPLDRLVDKEGRSWQPESTTEIRNKLFETHIDVDCLRVDGPTGT